jgi:hypothetical protein
MAPPAFEVIAPFDFEVEPALEVEVEPDTDTEPVDFVEELVVVVAFVELVNCAPMASAAAWKLAKELLLPSSPGLTANTMPLPQWLAAVFAAWRQ